MEVNRSTFREDTSYVFGNLAFFHITGQNLARLIEIIEKEPNLSSFSEMKTRN